MATGVGFAQSNVELPMIRRGKRETTYWNFTATPIRGEGGQIAGLLNQGVETTGQVLADRDLRASREQLQLAIEAADLGTWDLDLTSDTSTRSLRHDQMFGYRESQSDWGVENAERHVLVEDRAAFHAALNDAVSSGLLNFVGRVHGADGILRWIAAHGRTYVDNAGRPVRMSGVVADVADQKQTEIGLQGLNEALEQKVRAQTGELRLFRDIVESDRSPILAFDRECRVIGFNQAHRKEFQRVMGLIRRSATCCPTSSPPIRPKRSAASSIKVLFITGYAEVAVLGSVNLEPSMAVITKPFAIDDLANRIKELIAASSSMPRD